MDLKKQEAKRKAPVEEIKNFAVDLYNFIWANQRFRSSNVNKQFAEEFSNRLMLDDSEKTTYFNDNIGHAVLVSQCLFRRYFRDVNNFFATLVDMTTYKNDVKTIILNWLENRENIFVKVIDLCAIITEAFVYLDLEDTPFELKDAREWFVEWFIEYLSTEFVRHGGWKKLSIVSADLYSALYEYIVKHCLSCNDSNYIIFDYDHELIKLIKVSNIMFPVPVYAVHPDWLEIGDYKLLRRFIYMRPVEESMEKYKGDLFTINAELTQSFKSEDNIANQQNESNNNAATQDEFPDLSIFKHNSYVNESSPHKLFSKSSNKENTTIKNVKFENYHTLEHSNDSVDDSRKVSVAEGIPANTDEISTLVVCADINQKVSKVEVTDFNSPHIHRIPQTNSFYKSQDIVPPVSIVKSYADVLKQAISAGSSYKNDLKGAISDDILRKSASTDTSHSKDNSSMQTVPKSVANAEDLLKISGFNSIQASSLNTSHKDGLSQNISADILSKDSETQTFDSDNEYLLHSPVAPKETSDEEKIKSSCENDFPRDLLKVSDAAKSVDILLKHIISKREYELASNCWCAKSTSALKITLSIACTYLLYLFRKKLESKSIPLCTVPLLVTSTYIDLEERVHEKILSSFGAAIPRDHNLFYLVSEYYSNSFKVLYESHYENGKLKYLNTTEKYKVNEKTSPRSLRLIEIEKEVKENVKLFTIFFDCYFFGKLPKHLKKNTELLKIDTSDTDSLKKKKKRKRQQKHFADETAEEK